MLRHATAADRSAVVELALTFHHANDYSRLLSLDPERAIAAFDMALTHGVVLVGERDNVPGPGGPELVGFFALSALEHMLSGERYAEEAGWWVEPTYRSGTLGPRLLRAAEDWARTHDCAFLKLAAPFDPVNDTVASHVGRFYQRQGYQPIETAFFKRVA
jgi:GNAT superfamily N-acetyltransferase